MWWGKFGGVVRLIVTVQTHHTPEAGSGTDVSHIFVDNIHIICTPTAFVKVYL